MTRNPRFLIVLSIFHLLLCVGRSSFLQAQLSGRWSNARAYESMPVQDTLQAWYSIKYDNLFFTDTLLGIAYWRYNVRDSVRGSGWYRTIDGGTTWHPFSVTGITSDHLSRRRFSLRGSHGILVQQGSGGAMIPYLTDDSGHTWSPPPLPVTPVYEIVADDLRPTESEGVQNLAALHDFGEAYGFKKLEVSTDAGSSWRRLDSILFLGLPDSVRSRYSVLDLHWLRDTVLTLMTGVFDTTTHLPYNPELWDVGISGSVLRRQPLLPSFIVLRYNPGTAAIRSIRFSDSVWMVVAPWPSATQLALTTDAGRTWDTVQQTLFGVFATQYISPTMMLQGNTVSNDTGRTSRVWASPYGIGGLVVLDSLHWITSAGSIVAHTSDGGHSWTYKSGIQPINRMQVAGGTVLLTSTFHRLLRSRDRGETFNDVTDGLPSGITTISSLSVRDPNDSQKLAAVALLPSFELGELEVLLHSNDAGRTWQNVRDLTSLRRGKVYQLDFVRRSDSLGTVGWLTSDSGLSMTTDGGVTWINRSNQSRGYAMLNERTGWGFDSAAIWRSENGGMTWDTSYKLPVLYRPVRSLAAFDGQRAVAFLPKLLQLPTDWRIARTSNGGQDWDLLPSGMTFSLNSSRFIWINSNDLYMTDGGKMWLSRDGGVSFTAETPDSSGWGAVKLDDRSIYFYGKGMVARWDITDSSLSRVPVADPLTAEKKLDITSVRGGVIVQIPDDGEEYRVEVCDVTGRLLQRQEVAEGASVARINNLVTGWYAIRLVLHGKVVLGKGVVVMQ